MSSELSTQVIALVSLLVSVVVVVMQMRLSGKLDSLDFQRNQSVEELHRVRDLVNKIGVLSNSSDPTEANEAIACRLELLALAEVTNDNELLNLLNEPQWAGVHELARPFDGKKIHIHIYEQLMAIKKRSIREVS
ncbi:MAG: hypothetical protein ABI947_02925 [Chloroflexota bacterium]